MRAGHGTEDTFISPRHSRRLAAAYGGEDCRLLTFAGDHNSVRPRHFHAAVLAFFDAVLQCRSMPSAPTSVAGSGWVCQTPVCFTGCQNIALLVIDVGGHHAG